MGNIVTVDPFVHNDDHEIWDTLSITNCCSAPKELENAGKDCWKGCESTQGKCEWCGADGYCCRKGWTLGNGCDGSFGGWRGHTCVLNPNEKSIKIITTTTKTTTEPTKTTTEAKKCINLWKDKKCQNLAKKGRCNKAKFAKNCKEACELC